MQCDYSSEALTGSRRFEIEFNMVEVRYAKWDERSGKLNGNLEDCSMKICNSQRQCDDVPAPTLTENQIK